MQVKGLGLQELDVLLALKLLSLILPELVLEIESLCFKVYLLDLLLAQKLLNVGFEAVHLQTVAAKSLLGLEQLTLEVVCPSALVKGDSARPVELRCGLGKLTALVEESGSKTLHLLVIGPDDGCWVVAGSCGWDLVALSELEGVRVVEEWPGESGLVEDVGRTDWSLKRVW